MQVANERMLVVSDNDSLDFLSLIQRNCKNIGCAFRDNILPYTSFGSVDSHFKVSKMSLNGSTYGIRSQSFVSVMFVFQLSLLETSIRNSIVTS